MKAFTVARLGSDLEIRTMPNGDPVGTVSLAVKLSKKDKQGEYITQWISASMFGKRAESLAPYLKKGSQHAFYMRDLHIDEFVGKDGDKRASLKATIEDVELCSKSDDAGSRKPQPSQQSKPAQNGGGNGFEDMDDDLPF